MEHHYPLPISMGLPLCAEAREALQSPLSEAYQEEWRKHYRCTILFEPSLGRVLRIDVMQEPYLAIVVPFEGPHGWTNWSRGQTDTLLAYYAHHLVNDFRCAFRVSYEDPRLAPAWVSQWKRLHRPEEAAKL